MRMSEAALAEMALMREFMMTRVQAGVDVRSLVVGHAALLGGVAASCSVDEPHLQCTLAILQETMRNNAMVLMPAVGNA